MTRPAGASTSALPSAGGWPAVEGKATWLYSLARSEEPSLSPDGRRVAFVSDSSGRPELWLAEVRAREPSDASVRLELSEDPVVGSRWSNDGEWLAVAVATGGGVRTEMWAVRPDGTSPRRLLGNPEHVPLGAWSHSGHRCLTSLYGTGGDDVVVILDPDGPTPESVLAGKGIRALDSSADSRFILYRQGTRGAHVCLLWDRARNAERPLLPYPDTGSSDWGLLRPAPPGLKGMVAYLVTDAGMARTGVVAVPVTDEGERGDAGAIATRSDADVDALAMDGQGRLLLVVWNCAGRSEVEMIDLHTGRREISTPPESVVTGLDVSFDGRSAVAALEGPGAPSRLWHLDLASPLGESPERAWTPLLATPDSDVSFVEPTLESLVSHDGLQISGWLYRSQRAEPAPVLISLHGGPEAQERPSFHPEYQVLLDAGVDVFAPNIRGSSGFGRPFTHADDRYGRMDALDDVASCARFLLDQGVAAPGRIIVGGRSYGGYATLMTLIRHPGLFAAGIDICGMSDLLNFFRDSDPWISRAAVSKYGDPRKDRSLLMGLSPLRHVDRITRPLLVIHGSLDTNVPVQESRRLVAALHELGCDVRYVEIEGEGHEFRRTESRKTVIRAMVTFLHQVLNGHQ